MAIKPTNGVAMYFSNGIKDESDRVLPREPISTPQFLPLFFLRTEKGPTGGKVVSGNEFAQIFGEKSLDKDSPWFNHASLFANIVFKAPTVCNIMRIIPNDAGPRSNVTLYLDVLKTKVPNYKRNSDGSIVIQDGAKVVDDVTPEIDGIKLKWITETDTLEPKQLGTLSPKEGTMTGTAGKSQMYPIFEVRAAYKGAYYNNIGFTIGSPILKDFNMELANKTGMYPYTLSLYTRQTPESNAQVFKSLDGERSVTVALSNEKVVNPITKGQINFNKIFKDNFFTEIGQYRPSDYQGIEFYENNFNKIVKEVFDLELPYVKNEEITANDGEVVPASWYDFVGITNDERAKEYRLINLFNCRTSKNVPLYTAMIDNGRPTLTDGQAEVNLSSEKAIFLAGGSDGTLKGEAANAEYERGVRDELLKYNDENEFVVSDTVNNPQTVIIDSGFELETKLMIPMVTAYRHDTYYFLSTHQAKLGKNFLSVSETRAVASALNAAVALYPESVHYGTSACRGIIVGGAGKLADGSIEEYIPLTYEIAYKAAKFAGAGDGKWKKNEIFDARDNAVLTELVDIEPKYIPRGVRPKLWDGNVIFAEPFDMGGTYIFTGMQTVYNKDTSILNNLFVVMAISKLERSVEKAHRYFQGSAIYTKEQFKTNFENYLNRELKDAFGGIVIVIPTVYFTDFDKVAGYSYHVEGVIMSPDMITQCTYNTTARRLEN